MERHLKSRNHTHNVPKRQEVVPTDTVYSDTPAVDSGVITENTQNDTFMAPCRCFENAPNTALTIVCTISVSIHCKWSDVANLSKKKNILK